MAIGIEVTELSKRYGGSVALENVSISIEEGEFLTLLGSSGSGKTTLLSVIAGLTEPSSGDVRIRKKSVIGLPIHKRDIGLVFQSYSLFPHMTVAANVGYPLRLRGIKGSEYESRVVKALELVELVDFARRRPNELSGGQQQRTALARALIFEPSVLLLDEPLAALDRRLREHMKFELRRIHDQVGTTTVLVTHDQDEALALSDRIAVLNKGKLQQIGTPKEVYSRPGNKFIATFMGEANIIDGKLIRYADGWAAISTDGRIVHLPHHDEFVEQKAISIGIRAEEIELVSKTREHAWAGTVQVVTYLGNATRYLVSCGTHRFIVRVPSRDKAREFEVGDEVEMSWSPNAVQML